MTTHTRYYQTAAGILEITDTPQGIEQAFFVARVADELLYDVPQVPQLAVQGTPFQLKVWQATMNIPAGTTISYQELAQKIGCPQAHRAVARALAHNKIAYFIPCHRVVRKDGNLGGYKWGIERKQLLLKSESHNRC